MSEISIVAKAILKSLMADIEAVKRVQELDRKYFPDPPVIVEGDSVMKRVLEIIRNSNMTQEEIGIAMGYGIVSAKQSVNQFMRTRDPRVSVLRRFCTAMNVSMQDILS